MGFFGYYTPYISRPLPSMRNRDKVRDVELRASEGHSSAEAGRCSGVNRSNSFIRCWCSTDYPKISIIQTGFAILRIVRIYRARFCSFPVDILALLYCCTSFFLKTPDSDRKISLKIDGIDPKERDLQYCRRKLILLRHNVMVI